eukprot:COSAG01_NODE_7173_length_3319_cov_2.638509_5_plen_96_part_00
MSGCRAKLHADQLRAIYDKFGEVGLKQGVPHQSGGNIVSGVDRAGLTVAFAGGVGGRYVYAQNGDAIFQDFFGTANPFATIIEGALKLLNEVIVC